MEILPTNTAIIIPAFNEATVIEKTLRAALKLVSAEHIYIVDDGSDDLTYAISLCYTKNIIRVDGNNGKAEAINLAINHFQLTSRYQFILPIDADTVVSSDFLQNALTFFESDRTLEYVAVTGKVVSTVHNWLSAYRLWEYEVSQRVHKSAQAKENAIVVCAGCATLYRSSVFQQIAFSSDTVTEDMDLTFTIHRQKLGKIAFVSAATVKTQDPLTLHDYFHQINRWYRGFWQCLEKHQVPWGNSMLDFELIISTLEGLSGGVLVLLLPFLVPFILQRNWQFLAVPLLFDLLVFFIPSVYMTMFVHSELKLLKYLPQIYFLRMFNSLVFIYSFLQSVFTLPVRNWMKPTRYSLEGGLYV